MKQKIVIVGLGLIGGSLAKAFQKYTDAAVYGMDADTDVLRQALECGVIQAAATVKDLQDADLLYLCLYPQADIDFIEENGSAISSSCVVTDTCGIKNQICAKLPALAKQFGFSFVGGHPMAGRERNGFTASDADLFLGASYLIVPCGAPQHAVELVQATAMALGCSGTIVTTPEHHDAMIAFTSQLPHVLACAYVLSPRCPEHKGYSAGSYRDVSRVARINEALWTELFLDNADALTAELDTLIENLSVLRSHIAHRDAAQLNQILKKGREIKERLGE